MKPAADGPYWCNLYTPLGYIGSMEFMESQTFNKIREDYFDDDDFRVFQNSLMDNPEIGDRIKGSGGIRKVRWASRGKGKSGGIRVIYYYNYSAEQDIPDDHVPEERNH